MSVFSKATPNICRSFSPLSWPALSSHFQKNEWQRVDANWNLARAYAFGEINIANILQYQIMVIVTIKIRKDTGVQFWVLLISLKLPAPFHFPFSEVKISWWISGISSTQWASGTQGSVELMLGIQSAVWKSRSNSLFIAPYRKKDFINHCHHLLSFYFIVKCTKIQFLKKTLICMLSGRSYQTNILYTGTTDYAKL